MLTRLHIRLETNQVFSFIWLIYRQLTLSNCRLEPFPIAKHRNARTPTPVARSKDWFVKKQRKNENNNIKRRKKKLLIALRWWGWLNTVFADSEGLLWAPRRSITWLRQQTPPKRQKHNNHLALRFELRQTQRDHRRAEEEDDVSKKLFAVWWSTLPSLEPFSANIK